MEDHGNTVHRNRWSIAAAGGFVALLLFWLSIGWSFLGGLFAGIVVFAILLIVIALIGPDEPGDAGYAGPVDPVGSASAVPPVGAAGMGAVAAELRHPTTAGTDPAEMGPDATGRSEASKVDKGAGEPDPVSTAPGVENASDGPTPTGEDQVGAGGATPTSFGDPVIGSSAADPDAEEPVAEDVPTDRTAVGDSTLGQTVADDPVSADPRAGAVQDDATTVTPAVGSLAADEPGAPVAEDVPSDESAASAPDRDLGTTTQGPGTPADGDVTRDGAKPATLETPRDGQGDDLMRMKGVGPKLAALCNSLGIWHFDQIAGWSEAEVDWVDAHLEGFRGRVRRDDWVAQAKRLSSGGEAEIEPGSGTDDGEPR